MNRAQRHAHRLIWLLLGPLLLAAVVGALARRGRYPLQGGVATHNREAVR